MSDNNSQSNLNKTSDTQFKQYLDEIQNKSELSEVQPSETKKIINLSFAEFMAAKRLNKATNDSNKDSKNK